MGKDHRETTTVNNLLTKRANTSSKHLFATAAAALTLPSTPASGKSTCWITAIPSNIGKAMIFCQIKLKCRRLAEINAA